MLMMPECLRGLFRFLNCAGSGPRKSALDDVILRCPELTGDLVVIGDSVCAREVRGDCFAPMPVGDWVCTDIFGSGTVTVRFGKSGRFITLRCKGKCCGAPVGDIRFEPMRAPSFLDFNSACTSIPERGSAFNGSSPGTLPTFFEQYALQKGVFVAKHETLVGS